MFSIVQIGRREDRFDILKFKDKASNKQNNFSNPMISYAYGVESHLGF